MKKLTITMAMLLSLLIASVSFAAFVPSISLNPIGNLNFSEFPQVYEVTGTATSDKPIQDLGLYIDGELHGDAFDTISKGENKDETYHFSFDWNITEPGEYSVKVKGRHGNEWGNDSEEVIVSTDVVEVDYPAAPAVANKLLKDAGIGNMLGKGKNGINLISSVAHEMGPGTDFHGVEKSDTEAYEAAVKAFLNGFNGVNIK
ncbi:hypothetical protein MM300_04110 [Evansella sp. LMS18]|uniref:hypothetical protein n=1 Tax=Evansella sp. LMS18 TaxID=2924033 RepID=UPI0020D0EB76|nr:hypothetical protein [Evansella sp. LMS18]UTR11524.1 hypothetical protein MM300_04110 [Evansella sp. LMS18]